MKYIKYLNYINPKNSKELNDDYILTREYIVTFFKNEIENSVIDIICPDDEYWEKRKEKYSVGSDARIDWGDVINLRSTREFGIGEGYYNESREFCYSVFKEFNIDINTNVVLIGEMDIALIMPVKMILDNLNEIISEPQVFYVFPKDFSWCLHFPFHQYVVFGFSKVISEISNLEIV